MIYGALFSKKKHQVNQIVYSWLAVTTVGSTVHHLVKSFKNTKDGDFTCKSIFEWYDGYVIKNDTA